MCPRLHPVLVLLLLIAAEACGGGSSSTSMELAEPQALSGEGREAQAQLELEELAPFEPVRIMPLGDSITSAREGLSSYRYWLWNMLESAGFQVDFVGSQHGVQWGDPVHTMFDQDHEGHYGWRSDEILFHIPRLAAAFMPDYVLLHAGTNDIFQGQGIANAIHDLESIIDVLREQNPHITIILAQVIPADEHTWELEMLNQEIPGIAFRKSTLESPVVVVNQQQGFDYRRDTVDGIHPNESGERKMAGVWFNALAEQLMGSPV